MKPGLLHALQARHRAEEEALVRRALNAEDWRLPGTAETLGVAVSTLQRVLERHPALLAERDRRHPPATRAGPWTKKPTRRSQARR